MSVKKPVVEVHKFGGASLADGDAYRHAVAIVKGRADAPPNLCTSTTGFFALMRRAKRYRMG